eukprot:CAMPEP_0180271216 /NCGR_PEP_ID=MMETSP0988-20121125/3593_1 /TAXON_ID=697907 /ORGANISM="non described non described, Strain CCMP2293" /LENGTH=130 /DNA_ID=CAMNT_0022242205 /DNA_START=244 /DNA_END=632 /DNA_ORIENTATION=-
MKSTSMTDARILNGSVTTSNKRLRRGLPPPSPLILRPVFCLARLIAPSGTVENPPGAFRRLTVHSCRPAGMCPGPCKEHSVGMPGADSVHDDARLRGVAVTLLRYSGVKEKQLVQRDAARRRTSRGLRAT